MHDDAEWLARLREACAKDGQAAVARKLGVSPATVSQVLAGKYRADTAGIQVRVERHLGGRTVACPELGEIPVQECMTWRGTGFSAASPRRVKMWRACRGCQQIGETNGK